MKDTIARLRENFDVAMTEIHDTKALEALRMEYLKKKGPIQELMQGLRNATKEERPSLGKAINDIKVHIEERCSALEESLATEEQGARLSEENIDVTLPGKKNNTGKKHPVTQMLDKVLTIMKEMGFTVQYGPDIETDYYNFEALNFAEDHPARDMQDTFYIDKDVLLRTHTSNTQMRVMETTTPPIRIAVPGKCFRNETITARSHVFFHQVEALYIDENVTFADLMATAEEFFKKLFPTYDITTRIRPSYFPFVEPGMEIDISCLICGGEGCPICKGTGWLEVAGAGMVHQEVLKNGGLDPEKYSGYAWGLGIERLFMIQNSIKDIRLFFENDMRFLKQF
ncbi:MAG: phenylalanine--tRNA ligase subunit alpha [Waddliaceae bacterium]|jgi:phenylalanyl-tRNA synthetase alpha chain|nr:phenylalanine--tRNA ligase subunit alpha [Candidatus Jacksonbacteria bacterium]MBT3579611.1 phenylalanine--tRNA ligase subunit alpha [Waddliaceae bacterium]MBT6928787.1 phenylalanine--tRNA ligase subunit alpha [Waddliaceae bacterium]MBT7264769.1 phenylalanine--tRNA ligase subunit alpha [Waddliaceae bacterium]